MKSKFHVHIASVVRVRPFFPFHPVTLEVVENLGEAIYFLLQNTKSLIKFYTLKTSAVRAR